MITGFNTDIEYDGTVYHVQTEDKGVSTPVILSLVYREGAILASKRTPYDDLVATGFDQAILAKRLQRQHKLICAAVHAGRIEELKRMNEGPAKAKKAKPKSEQSVEVEEPETVPLPGEAAAAADNEPPRFSIAAAPEDDEKLKVALLEEPQLVSGTSVTLRVLVTKAADNDQRPIAKARVSLKVLGTSFRPNSTITTSDNEGVALIVAQLPQFTTGRAAILVQAEADGEMAELRRIILPA
jgi:hypothetical protein